MDIKNIVAIDVHTHAEVSSRISDDPMWQAMQEASAQYFKDEGPRPTIAEVAAYYRERKMIAVIFPVDIEHFGVRGFKFHPSMQAFYPNDRSAYVLYEVIAEAGLPAVFHTGHSGIGTGMRGGGGVHLKYSNPMYLDDVAVDFPDMPIIMAHPSFPWQDEALSVCLHKPQVYIDLSGWSPKYFPPQLIQYANTLLKHKVLFGSDYPLITPDRWLADFEQIPIRPEVRPLILKENAIKLLRLDNSSALQKES
jgi:predicted TIM-barrel fold metal-dependent hydrolase